MQEFPLCIAIHWQWISQFLNDENSDGELMSVELTKWKHFALKNVVRPHEMQYWKDVWRKVMMKVVIQKY